MGAFEFENNTINTRSCGLNSNLCGNFGGGDKGETCIIAQKIFDQCRIQKCLTPDILGPARTAGCGMGNCGCNDMMCEGEIIVPPANATSVTLHNTELDHIDIVQKCPSSFQEGCWDLELRYVFTYTLEFRRADGCTIGCIDATSSYNLKVSLFGSTEANITSVTDLYDCCGNSNGGPFVIAEGKAVGLNAELKYHSHCNPCNCTCNCDCDCGDHPSYRDGNYSNNGYNGGGDSGFGTPIAVNVTLGLFTIIKLYRTVNMLVQSLGRCVPEQFKAPNNNNNTDPCKYFDSVPFPLDLFSPTTKPHPCCGFGEAYTSLDCSENNTANDGCGCGCNTNHNNNTCNTGCNNTLNNSGNSCRR